MRKSLLSAIVSASCLLASPSFASDGADAHTIDDAVKLVLAGQVNEAKATFEALATAGNPVAYYHLGALHHAGIGGEADIKKAIFYYDKASDEGVMEAKLALGAILYKGTAVPQDLARALTLFTEAAEAGLIWAQYNLAMMHTAGLAHTKEHNANEDKPRAYMWFSVVIHRLDDENLRAEVKDGLAFLAADMTPWEINKGQEMAAQWIAQHQPAETTQ